METMLFVIFVALLSVAAAFALFFFLIAGVLKIFFPFYYRQFMEHSFPKKRQRIKC